MKYKKEMLGTSKGNISLTKKGSRRRTAKRMLFISIILICLFLLSITNIQAVDPPISISYPFESLSIWYGNAVIGKMPTVEGGTPTLFEVNPPLPEGLAFDPETGTIGGKNNDLQGISGKQEYTVTASNEAGSVSCVIFIEIKPPARLTGDPLAIVRGEKATLEWRVSNIGSPEVTISNIGSVERTGTIEVSPEETTTYSIDIEAGGYFFENVRSVTIQVGSSSELPEPVITVYPSTTVEVGEPVIFDGRSSTDNEPLGKEDGLVNTYVWDYGDGSEVTEKNWGFRSGAVCMHYFMKPGTFPVTLTVNDRDGFRNSTTLDITVKGEAPMEGFEVLNAPFHARIAQKILVHIPDSVIDDPTNQLQATLSGPERDRILFQKSGLSSEEEFLLDHRGLSRGEYVLQVKILDNNGHQLPGGLWKEKFSKEYEGIPRVGIDENNAVRVDGELHFPVQNWMMNFAYLPDYQTMKAINGVFYLTGGHISWYDSENEEWIYDLDILKSSYNEVLEPKGLMGITADRWSGKQTDNGALRNSDPSNIINYINELKDSPSVLAWCWDDEPNLDGWQSGGIPPQVLSAWHHMTSIEDPHHPTLTNLAGYMFCPGKIYKEEFSMMFSDQVLGKKAAVADIIHGALFALEAYKNYPDPEDPTRGAIDVYTDYLNNRREWNYDLLPTMAVSAPVRIILTDPAYYGPPTPDEVRMLNWLNVVHGVKGMNWYPYYGYTPAENFATMGEISQQLQELAPVILGPDKTDISVIDNANTKGNRVDTMIKETDDAYYLFTVRLTEREWWDDPSIEPEQISATFNITGLPDVVEATEYLEHKKIFENHGTESGGTDFNFTLEQDPVPGTISIGGVYKQSGSGESLNRKYYYIFDDSQGNIYLNGYWKEGGTLPAGTINYDTGEVSIYFPDMWGSDRKVEILPGIDCIVASYEPVREERRITIENGEFTDTFIRNGVHIYRIPKQFEENMHPPVLELIDKQTIEVGVNNCFDISAIDEDGGGLSYSAEFMPEGAEFNEDTREFTWNPSEEQVGTYLVEFTVTDLSGLTDSMEVILDVIKPVSTAPFIEEQPLSQAVKEGAEVTFSIVADGHPDPSYQWKYNGNDIEGATEVELTLTNVTTDNSGQYTVEVTNEHGSVSSDPANLIVVESPPSVENIECIVEYHTTYLSWNNPENNDDIWNNVLIIRKKDSEPDNYKDGEEIYNGKGTSLTDRRLDDGTYYYAVYTYKNTDINNVYSDGIIIAVTIPDEFNKNYLSIDSDQKERLLIGQNTRGDLYSLWNSPTSTIGRGPGGNEICLWVYSDIIGESIDQIPAGSDIIHAGLIFSVKDNSFNTEDIIQKARSINVYRIIDPDNLGLPHYADESGIRVGLDFNYRDHRPGVNIPWQIHDGDSSQSTQVNSGDILSLLEGVEPVDTLDFYPDAFVNKNVNTVQFDITNVVQAWANGEVEQGLFMTTGQGWENGEQLQLYGVSADVNEHENNNENGGQNLNQTYQPYIEIIYAESGIALDLTPPEPVSDLTMVPASDSIILEWSRPTDLDFAGVKIIRREGIVPFNNQDENCIAFIEYDDSNNDSYTDTGLESGNTYYYAVYTFDSEFNYSEKVWIKATPGSPAETPVLDDPVIGSGTVSLSWNQVEGADKYRIYRKDSNGNISLLEEIEQEENLSYIDYIPLGEYIYWLTAVNQYGEGPLSDKKTVVVSEVASSEPQAPTALEGQALSGSKIELNWTDNSDNELTFVIERQDEGGEWQEIVRTAYNSTHYIDVQLQPASNYNYRIKAENSAGASEYSTVISVPTLDLPVAVTDLRWEVISANQIKVEWEDTPNEGSYRVELFKLTNDEGIMGEEVVDIQFLSANMTYCYFVTLEPGREYRVRLTTIVGEDEVSIESDIIRTSADSKGGLF